MPATPPPPPPPPPPSTGGGGGRGASSKPTTQRAAFLGQIQGGARLKKTVTNDRSAPQLASGGGVGSGRGGAGGGAGGGASTSTIGGPPQLAGLFAGGMPKLKSTKASPRVNAPRLPASLNSHSNTGPSSAPPPPPPQSQPPHVPSTKPPPIPSSLPAPSNAPPPVPGTRSKSPQPSRLPSAMPHPYAPRRRLSDTSSIASINTNLETQVPPGGDARISGTTTLNDPTGKRTWSSTTAVGTTSPPRDQLILGGGEFRFTSPSEFPPVPQVRPVSTGKRGGFVNKYFNVQPFIRASEPNLPMAGHAPTSAAPLPPPPSMHAPTAVRRPSGKLPTARVEQQHEDLSQFVGPGPGYSKFMANRPTSNVPTKTASTLPLQSSLHSSTSSKTGIHSTSSLQPHKLVSPPKTPPPARPPPKPAPPMLKPGVKTHSKPATPAPKHPGTYIASHPSRQPNGNANSSTINRRPPPPPPKPKPLTGTNGHAARAVGGSLRRRPPPPPPPSRKPKTGGTVGHAGGGGSRPPPPLPPRLPPRPS